jgi:hypothetical protein
MISPAMNPFHTYLSESLEEKLRSRRVVVIYEQLLTGSVCS